MKILKLFKKSEGLTLVELLVSMAVMITSATIVVAIITASLRGASKTNVSEDLRQSGNSALAQISKIIQFSDNFESAVVADEGNEGEIETVCSAESDNYSEINIDDNGASKKISCSVDINGVIDVQIDDTSVLDLNKVTVNECRLTCSQADSTTSPIIGIYFELQSANDLEDKSGSVVFEKSVKIRNSNQ